MYRISYAKAIPPKGEGFPPGRWNNKFISARTQSQNKTGLLIKVDPFTF
jgi:hypothetical protein